MLLTLQQSMQAACYGDAAGFAAVLPHLAPTTVPTDKALYIHTATVTAALTALLSEAYPSVRNRMGDTAFAEIARNHLRAHPPGPAVLSAYGDGFADSVPPALRTLAAADWAAHCAYFAADTVTLTADSLSALPADSVFARPLPLAPSVRLLTAGDVADWQAGRTDLVIVPPPMPLPAAPPCLLVWRGRDLLVASTLLPVDAGCFVGALDQGLAVAAAHLCETSSLSPLLAMLLTHGLLAAPALD